MLFGADPSPMADDQRAPRTITNYEIVTNPSIPRAYIEMCLMRLTGPPHEPAHRLLAVETNDAD